MHACVDVSMDAYVWACLCVQPKIWVMIENSQLVIFQKLTEPDINAYNIDGENGTE